MLLTQIHLHRHTTTILHASMTVGRVVIATTVIREFPLRGVRIIRLYWHFGIMQLLCHVNEFNAKVCLRKLRFRT